jgi:type IV pilus assembly protein PilO
METNKKQSAFDSFLDNKVAGLNKTHKIIICLAFAILPTVAFYFLFFSPKSVEIKGLETNVAKLQKEIATVKIQAAKLDQFLAEKKESERKFKEASLVIPDSKEIPSLLTNISSQASGSGLDIASFVPKGEIPKEFYAEIPVSIKVNGTYHNVGFFLDSVSKLPRLVNVVSLTLGGAKEVEEEMLLGSSIQLVTYKFIEPKNDAQKK